MMANAAQKYGMVVNDRGGAVAFKAEDPYLYTQQFGIEPYGPYLFGGVPASQLAAAFPWQYVQAVKP